MEALPLDAKCKILSLVLTDEEAVTSVLNADQSMVRCLPFVVKEYFSLHDLPRDPYEYLDFMWGRDVSENVANTILRAAARVGDPDLVVSAVEAGATDIKVPFLLAAGNGYLDVARYLARVEPLRVSTFSGASTVAAKRGHLNVLKYFLPSELRSYSRRGRQKRLDNLLRETIVSGDPDVIEYLIQEGAVPTPSFAEDLRQEGHQEAYELVKSLRRL